MASYQTSTQTNISLESVTYVGCPIKDVPQKYTYPPLSATIGPTPETATYEPLVLIESKDDPSKGRPFNKLKKDGAILMSPYSVRSMSVENSLLTTTHNEPLWRWEGFRTSNDSGCRKVDFIRALEMGSYTKTYDLERLMRLYPNMVTYNTETIDFDEVPELVASTQTAVIADALSGYDLLTEIAESRETFSFITGKVSEFADSVLELAREDENAWRRGRRLTTKDLLKSSDRALRKLGGRWMEYRYAIMPLFYSLKDVTELMGSSDARYKTSRKKGRIESIRTDTSLPVSGFFLERVVTGTIIVSSTSKARFDLEGLTSLYAHSISLNPFKTAWELVPLSFVIDWFLNIGDVITTATSIDFSSQRVNCTSVRTAYEELLYFNQMDTQPKTLPERTWEGVHVAPYTYDSVRRQRTLLRKAVVNNYDRMLFGNPPLKIQFDPFLNWKRMIDGVVLSYQPTKKLLRSLR